MVLALFRRHRLLFSPIQRETKGDIAELEFQCAEYLSRGWSEHYLLTSMMPSSGPFPGMLFVLKRAVALLMLIWRPYKLRIGHQ